ncbi:hypothetical protein D3C73_1296530 [compost metagenome]
MVATGGRAQRVHQVLPGNRRGGTQQYRNTLTDVTADDIAAPVHAIGEVDIEMARFAEHAGVARGHAAPGVCRRIFAAGIRFDLDNARHATVVAHQQFVQQLGCDHR